MSNQVTINLDKLSLSHLRVVSSVCEAESGLAYNLDIWAALVNNRGRLEDEGRRERNNQGIEWVADYIEEAWEEATLSSGGYLGIAHLLDNAADATKADQENLFKAGAFDALAEAGASFLADDFGMGEAAAKAAIYAHYGIDF